MEQRRQNAKIRGIQEVVSFKSLSNSFHLKQRLSPDCRATPRHAWTPRAGPHAESLTLRAAPILRQSVELPGLPKVWRGPEAAAASRARLSFPALAAGTVRLRRAASP